MVAGLDCDFTIHQPDDLRGSARALARRPRSRVAWACAASGNETVKLPRSTVSFSFKPDTWPRSFNVRCADDGVSPPYSCARNVRFEAKGAFVSVQASIALLCAGTRKTYDR
jgi:hypothetical protein